MLGEVETLSRKAIRGWVHARSDQAPVFVDILFDGHKIKRLRADFPRDSDSQGVGRRGFKFRIGGTLVPYVHSSESLEFRVGDAILPIQTNLLKPAAKRLRRPVAELVDLLGRGYIVTKKGNVILSIHLDEAWKARVFAFYARARSVFREVAGYDLHITYGTLLGRIRQGGFIPGDDDFDTAYLSRHEDPALVRQEMLSILKRLQDAGEIIRVGKRRNLFYWTSSDGVSIDVFPAWLRGDEYFMAFAVGAPAAAALREGFEEIDFDGWSVLAPVRAEAVLEAIYGRNWRTPDPLFQWRVAASLKREMDAVKLSPEDKAAIDAASRLT